MDERLVKNVLAGGREPRAKQNKPRQGADDNLLSKREKRRLFQNEFMQEALPKAPEIPGFHVCWLSTTNTYDPIHKRTRLGYTPVTADEVPGNEHLRVKEGEHAGLICVNEMMLFKLPMDVYQGYMAEVHHYMPLDEEEKIQVQQEQLLNAKDTSGRKLGQIEGDGLNFDLDVDAPTFE